MANKETVNKVKSLLEGHCYGPLREAAEKWLAAADEKEQILYAEIDLSRTEVVRAQLPTFNCLREDIYAVAK